MENLQASFVGSEQWSKLFQRNNKSTGLKNLRCFPRCSDTHESRAFCGRSITVEFVAQESTAEKLSGLRSWIELGPVEDKLRFAVGSLVSKDELDAQTRSADKPSLPLLAGAQLDSRQANTRGFEFNQRQKGWHYGHVTNKHKSDCEHCVRAYAMVPVGENQFRCVATEESPRFRIFCRRRQRHKMNLSLLPDSLRDHILKSAESKAALQSPSSSAVTTTKRKARGKNSKSTSGVKRETAKRCCSGTAASNQRGRRLTVSPLNSPSAGHRQAEINPRAVAFDGPESWNSATAKNSEDLRLETEAWFAADNSTSRPRYPQQYAQTHPQQHQYHQHQQQQHQQFYPGHHAYHINDAVLAEVELLLSPDDAIGANSSVNMNQHQSVAGLTSIAPKPFFATHTHNLHDGYFVDNPSNGGGFSDMLSF